jgi:predicted RNA-binding protein
MLESDVYGPLANWMKTHFNLEWAKTTHENPCIIFNDDREIAEVDLILGNHKMNQLNMTDVVHVKTKENLQQKKDRYELIGKSRFTLGGAPRVWLAIENSTYRSISHGLEPSIGIITYEDKGKLASGFMVKKEPERTDTPMYLKETQQLINQKFGTIIETSQYIFVCSLSKEKWEICKQHKLWGVPEKATAAESALRRAKPWDILLFRINGGPDYVAIWMVTSKPFVDNDGGPWRRENPTEKRNFVLQVKMHPMLVEQFKNTVKLQYPNGMNQETGITTKFYMSGMAEITDVQYKIIAKKIIDLNLDQLN